MILFQAQPPQTEQVVNAYYVFIPPFFSAGEPGGIAGSFVGGLFAGIIAGILGTGIGICIWKKK